MTKEKRILTPSILKDLETKTLNAHKGVLNSVENIEVIKKKLNEYRLNKMNYNSNYSNSSNQKKSNVSANKENKNSAASNKNTLFNTSNANIHNNPNSHIYKGTSNETTLKQYIYNKINSKDFNTINAKKKANLSRSHSIINN